MDPGSIAVGALVGTVWWIIFIFYVFLPKIKQLRTDMEWEKDRIEAKIDEQLNKIPNIDATIMRVKDEIRQELELIKTDTDIKELLRPVMLELSKPPDQWDEQYFQVFSNISNIAVSQVRWMVDNDEAFNKWFYDKMKGLTMNMKKELRAEMTEAVPEIAKSMGIPLDAVKEAGEMLENIPEEYRWMVQLGMMLMKGDIPGMGGGAGGATTPYRGF